MKLSAKSIVVMLNSTVLLMCSCKQEDSSDTKSEKNQPVEVSEDPQKVIDSVNKMNKLLDGVVDMARIEEQQSKIFVELNVNEAEIEANRKRTDNLLAIMKNLIDEANAVGEVMKGKQLTKQQLNRAKKMVQVNLQQIKVHKKTVREYQDQFTSLTEQRKTLLKKFNELSKQLDQAADDKEKVEEKQTN